MSGEERGRNWRVSDDRQNYSAVLSVNAAWVEALSVSEGSVGPTCEASLTWAVAAGARARSSVSPSPPVLFIFRRKKEFF